MTVKENTKASKKRSKKSTRTSPKKRASKSSKKGATKRPKKKIARFDSNRLAAIRACLEHARALLGSARAVQTAGFQNIAYHLAVLTLEEIGRRELMVVQAISESRPIPPAWVQKHMENHVKKLFWCFFGADFFKEKLTKEKFESMQAFSQQIHLNRLDGLYVGHTDDGVSIPSEAIDDEQAETLLKLAEVRLDMAESGEIREDISKEELELQAWFLSAAEDSEKERMIFSKGSLNKLAELGKGREWISWLKEEFEKADAVSLAAIEEELKRGRGLVTDGKNKWKLRIRLFTQSHSIRPKAVTKWNKTIDWIKLVPVSGKKNQLIVEFILLDKVPLEGLWWFGWGLARQFVTALNIGTMGFWWWRMPEQTNRFYERIDDLERKTQISVERSPDLKVDWGENRVLTEGDLSMVSSCFVALPGPGDKDMHKPYNYYIGGVTFLSLNDVHWQCESTAFGNFFECIKAMMAQKGDWQLETPFTPCLMKFLDKMFPGFDEREHYFTIFEGFEKQAFDAIPVTLKEASFMKLFCDAYFLNEVRPKALEEITAAQGEESI